jgi:hypothetical protein
MPNTSNPSSTTPLLHASSSQKLPTGAAEKDDAQASLGSSALCGFECMSYHAMRMRRCKTEVIDFFKRWGVYLLVALLIPSLGTNAPWSVVTGMVSTLVMPLFRAAHDLGLLAATGVGYALAGVLPVVLARALWWPRHWGPVEAALPLPRQELQASDRIMTIWMMWPWQFLLLLGNLIVLAQPGASATQSGAAIGVWAVSAIASFGLSVAWMRRVRGREAQKLRALQKTRQTHITSLTQVAKPLHAMHWWTVFFALALRRGPLHGCAYALILGSVSSVACGVSALLWSGGVGWSLSLLGGVGLICAAFLRARCERELRPLLLASQHLPLKIHALARARTLLALFPVGLGLLIVLPGLLIVARQPGLVFLYAVVLAASCIWEALQFDKPSHRAARWLLSLALMMAISFSITHL